jgi:hypothetical protein
MLKTVQSRTETQIETLSSRKNKDFFGYVFNDTYICRNELTHWVSMQKDVSEEKKRKEKNN